MDDLVWQGGQLWHPLPDKVPAGVAGEGCVHRVHHKIPLVEPWKDDRWVINLKKRGLLFDLKKQHFFVIGTVKSELINTGNIFLPTKTIRDIRFSCKYRLKHFKAQLTKSSIKINFWLVYGQAQLKLLYLLNCVHSHTGATPTSSVEEPEPVWRAGSS